MSKSSTAPSLFSKRNHSWKIATLLLGLSLPVCLPLFTTLQLSGHDAQAYFPRLVEFHENIRHGILLPRWAPDLGSGFGQPFFLFSPPLFYYIAELWHLLGLEVVTALNATSISIVVGSAAAMYFLGKLYFGPAGGVLAAAAYIYAPYFLTDLYVRHALTEFLTFPFYPLTLFGLAGYVRSRSKLFLMAAAAGYAAILFSHNPEALLFTPLLFAFVLFNAWRTKSWAVLGWQVGALLLGLSLAACIWVPILAEKDAVSVHRLLQGTSRYTNHFVQLRHVFSIEWEHGLGGGGSFSLGWSHVILGVAVWELARRWPERVDRALLAFFTLTLLALCVLMLPVSQSLWDRIILLQYVQFPWRLLAPVVVCMALLVAPIGILINETGIWGRFWVVVAVALIVLPNISHASPRRYYNMNFKAFTPGDFARLGISVTTWEEFEPIWVTKRAPYRNEKIDIISGDARVSALTRGPDHLSANVAVREQSLLELGIIYFPGWRVWLDGAVIETKIANETGLIRFVAPPGEHRLDARFTRTAPRWIGEGLSLLAAAIFCYLAWWWWPREKVRDGLPITHNRPLTPQKRRASGRRPRSKKR